MCTGMSLKFNYSMHQRCNCSQYVVIPVGYIQAGLLRPKAKKWNTIVPGGAPRIPLCYFDADGQIGHQD